MNTPKEPQRIKTLYAQILAHPRWAEVTQGTKFALKPAVSAAAVVHEALGAAVGSGTSVRSN
jgi:hypothetical protein